MADVTVNGQRKRHARIVSRGRQDCKRFLTYLMGVALQTPLGHLDDTFRASKRLVIVAHGGDSSGEQQNYRHHHIDPGNVNGVKTTPFL
jgi:hypothetical protein